MVNPYAKRLTFADARTRTRRDHLKYLTLIRAIALLHQHQRPKRTATVAGRTVTYIEAARDDVVLANRLAHRVLGRSLDELPPGTRRLLDHIEGWVTGQAGEQGVARERVRFTRRELRERLGWGDTQLKVHLARLVSLELVHAHRAGPAGAFVYELAWDGTGAGGEEPHLAGLIDPDHLGYDEDRSGSEGNRSGPGRGPVGPRSAPGRAAPDGENAPRSAGFAAVGAGSAAHGTAPGANGAAAAGSG
ncbi:MAG TPA: hypothetical protein VHF89_00890 [Solirubrobacteraceae bacterium]|nr:hypothetical protein [Solirubrobacteraceae bacterium]